MAKLGAKRDTTNQVQKASDDALRALAGIADLAVRLIQRQFFGSPRREDKEDLALAELRVFQLACERGAYRKALFEVDDVRTRRAELTAQKAADATTAALPQVESAYTTAIAAMTAMGLSAARTQQLTTIMRTLTDSSETALTAANIDAAKSGANVCLNKTTDAIQAKVDKYDAKHDRYQQAVIDEGARLGIRI